MIPNKYHLRTFVENTQREGIYPAVREDLRVTIANAGDNLEVIVDKVILLGILSFVIPVAVCSLPVMLYDSLTNYRNNGSDFYRSQRYKQTRL